MKQENNQPAGGDFLVIGYGNTLRGDDGVGPRVAEAIHQLALPGVRALVCPMLTPELADPISRAHTVIFVDAAVDAPKEVQLRPLDSTKRFFLRLSEYSFARHLGVSVHALPSRA